MPVCPFCKQEIDFLSVKSTQLYEGTVTLDDKGNIDYDDHDNREGNTVVACPKCGVVIIPDALGPYDPRIESFLKGSNSNF